MRYISLFLILFLNLSVGTFAQAPEDDVYDCIRAAESMQEMEHCGDIHIQYWKNRMESLYDQLRANVNQTRLVMVESSQESWNNYRRQQVALSNAIHFGSSASMDRVFAKIREANLYRERSRAIEELIEIQQGSN